MIDKRFRQQIALEAARLLYAGQETDYVRAKRKAARAIGRRCLPRQLPSNRQIRQQIDRLDRLHKADRFAFDLRAVRLEALRMMQLVAPFEPRLRGPVWTGQGNVAAGIVIRVNGASPADVARLLAAEHLRHRVRTPDLPGDRADGAGWLVELVGLVGIRIEIDPREASELSDEPEPAWQAGSIMQLRALLKAEFPELDLEAELAGLEAGEDRFAVFRYLLLQLEEVNQDPRRHPEGDALYHSLQVFDLAVNERPYDEEFLTAALLHDVGKAIDARDPVVAGLAALEGLITRRTRWFIAQLESARRYRAKELALLERGPLEATRDFEELLLFSELDETGRASGVETSTIDEALDYLRALEAGDVWE